MGNSLISTSQHHCNYVGNTPPSRQCRRDPNSNTYAKQTDKASEDTNQSLLPQVRPNQCHQDSLLTSHLRPS